MTAPATRPRSRRSARAPSGKSGSVPDFGSDRFEAKPLDAVHVRAFEADELRRAGAARRVEVALVVEVGGAGRELVGAQRLRLARLVGACRRDERIVGHLGLALRLAVDRPGGAVVVRRRVLRALVLVREDAEAELGVLVKHLALRGLSIQSCRNEIGIAQQRLQAHADLAPPRRSRLGLEDGVALGRELL